MSEPTQAEAYAVQTPEQYEQLLANFGVEKDADSLLLSEVVDLHFVVTDQSSRAASRASGGLLTHSTLDSIRRTEGPRRESTYHKLGVLLDIDPHLLPGAKNVLDPKKNYPKSDHTQTEKKDPEDDKDNDGTRKISDKVAKETLSSFREVLSFLDDYRNLRLLFGAAAHEVLTTFERDGRAATLAMFDDWKITSEDAGHLRRLYHLTSVVRFKHGTEAFKTQMQSWFKGVNTYAAFHLFMSELGPVVRHATATPSDDSNRERQLTELQLSLEQAWELQANLLTEPRDRSQLNHGMRLQDLYKARQKAAADDGLKEDEDPEDIHNRRIIYKQIGDFTPLPPQTVPIAVRIFDIRDLYDSYNTGNFAQLVPHELR